MTSVVPPYRYPMEVYWGGSSPLYLSPASSPWGSEVCSGRKRLHCHLQFDSHPHCRYSRPTAHSQMTQNAPASSCCDGKRRRVSWNDLLQNKSSQEAKQVLEGGGTEQLPQGYPFQQSSQAPYTWHTTNLYTSRPEYGVNAGGPALSHSDDLWNYISPEASLINTPSPVLLSPEEGLNHFTTSLCDNSPTLYAALHDAAWYYSTSMQPLQPVSSQYSDSLLSTHESECKDPLLDPRVPQQESEYDPRSAQSHFTPLQFPFSGDAVSGSGDTHDEMITLAISEDCDEDEDDDEATTQGDGEFLGAVGLYDHPSLLEEGPSHFLLDFMKKVREDRDIRPGS